MKNKNEIIVKAEKSINMDGLDELIKQHDYKIVKVAMETGIEESVLYKYLRGARIPTTSHLVSLANFFQCNIDYLIGRTTNPTTYENIDKKEIEELLFLSEQLTKRDLKLLNKLISTYIKDKQKNKEKDKYNIIN